MDSVFTSILRQCNNYKVSLARVHKLHTIYPSDNFDILIIQILCEAYKLKHYNFPGLWQEASQISEPDYNSNVWEIYNVDM